MRAIDLLCVEAMHSGASDVHPWRTLPGRCVTSTLCTHRATVWCKAEGRYLDARQEDPPSKINERRWLPIRRDECSPRQKAHTVSSRLISLAVRGSNPVAGTLHALQGLSRGVKEGGDTQLTLRPGDHESPCSFRHTECSSTTERFAVCASIQILVLTVRLRPGAGRGGTWQICKQRVWPSSRWSTFWISPL